MLDLDLHIQEVAMGCRGLRPWEIPDDVPDDVRPFLEHLNLPASMQTPDQPDLLLHDLGSFQKDNILKSRLGQLVDHGHRQALLFLASSSYPGS